MSCPNHVRLEYREEGWSILNPDFPERYGVFVYYSEASRLLVTAGDTPEEATERAEELGWTVTEVGYD